MAESYLTLAAPLIHEIPKIKGSRFIASAAPAADEAEATAHVAATRRIHHASRHVCAAWRLGEDGEVTKASDDGEPSGSAGRPILAAIRGQDLTFVVVAVTRYFGGTKLGVGGLVRAYGGAASEVLARVEPRIVVPMSAVEVETNYAHADMVQRFAARAQVGLLDAEYGARVRLVYELPVAAAAGFCEQLFDLSSGAVQPRVLAAELSPDLVGG